MDILMPQLGETVAEGKITTWFKAVGDSVKPGDNLFEIETDKVSMEVPATAAGVVSEIRVAAGEVAPVGAVVAVLGGAADAAAAASATTRQPLRKRRLQTSRRHRKPLRRPLQRSPIHARRRARPPRRSSSIPFARSRRPNAIGAPRSSQVASSSPLLPAASPASMQSILVALCRRGRADGSLPAMSRAPWPPVRLHPARPRRPRIGSKRFMNPAATRRSRSMRCGARLRRVSLRRRERSRIFI